MNHPGKSDSNDDELEQFRQQWKSELRHPPSTPDPNHPSGSHHPPSKARKVVIRHPQISKPQGQSGWSTHEQHCESPPVYSSNTELPSHDTDAIPAPDVEIREALDLYADALEHEISGRLADALHSYRLSFKLDPDVDVKYNLVRKTDNLRFQPMPPSSAVPHDESLLIDQLDSLVIVNDHAQPMDVTKPMYILQLPHELIYRIFQVAISADLNLYSHLSLVCHQFHALCNDSSIWKFVCQRHYPHRDLNAFHYSTLRWIDYFRNEPRLRTDGAYISSNRYFRPGYSETSMNAPILIVEYYRYLRFFRNGTVISLMTSKQPIEVIKNLTQPNRRGFQFGTYSVHSSQVQIELQDKFRKDEQFNVTLRIHVNKRRVNRISVLNWESYSIHDSGSLGNADQSVFDLSEFKPFVFSRVNSYVQM